MELKNILYEKSEGIATITINRPKALNALNEETIQEILSTMDDEEKDKNIRVVIITGAGDRAFSAGADINMLKAGGALATRRTAQLGQRLMNEVEDLENR